MRPRYYGLSYLLAASSSSVHVGCSSSPKPNLTMLADSTKIASNTPEPVAPPPAEGIDTESTIFTWLGMAKRPSERHSGPQVGTDVSLSLWLAAHDTLKFVQIASEDPANGLMITDWYTPTSKPEERMRVTVLITSYALRSDSLALTIDRQVRGADGKWTDNTVDSKTVGDLEGAILLRARQIHAETYRNTVMSQ